MLNGADCDLLRVCNVLGKKWTIKILHILKANPASYTELFDLCHKEINPTLLADRLKELIAFGIIEHNEKRYLLTKTGHQFYAVLLGLKSWVEKSGLKMPADCGNLSCSCIELKKNK